MDNFILLPKSTELEQLSTQLGFTRTLFLHRDIALITEKNAKEALKQIQQARQQKLLTVYKPVSEELLRFVLEKTPVEMVLGAEQIHGQDALHYPRAGLDQIVCKIAADKGKILAFSGSDLLKARDRSQLLGRMIFNIGLCQKYNVKMFFSTFAQDKWELRAAHDLLALWKVLGGKGKQDLVL